MLAIRPSVAMARAASWQLQPTYLLIWPIAVNLWANRASAPHAISSTVTSLLHWGVRLGLHQVIACEPCMPDNIHNTVSLTGVRVLCADRENQCCRQIIQLSHPVICLHAVTHSDELNPQVFST